MDILFKKSGQAQEPALTECGLKPATTNKIQTILLILSKNQFHIKMSPTTSTSGTDLAVPLVIRKIQNDKAFFCFNRIIQFIGTIRCAESML